MSSQTPLWMWNILLSFFLSVCLPTSFTVTAQLSAIQLFRQPYYTWVHTYNYRFVHTYIHIFIYTQNVPTFVCNQKGRKIYIYPHCCIYECKAFLFHFCLRLASSDCSPRTYCSFHLSALNSIWIHVSSNSCLPMYFLCDVILAIYALTGGYNLNLHNL